MGTPFDTSKMQDIYSSTSYNVNANHPLTPNSQEYISYRKFVSIHSEDRDMVKYPVSTQFEIELPEDYTNVASIRLVQWTFPANYNVFSGLSQNVTMTFRINNPYDPVEYNVFNTYYERIFEALSLNDDPYYFIIIEEGFYNPSQIAIELTNKFNNAVTTKIQEYFTTKGWTDTLDEFNNNGGYTRFQIVYNNVGLKLWFGNTADGFILTNETSLIENKISNNLCFIGRNQVPSTSDWGLPNNLGLNRCNTGSISGLQYDIQKIIDPNAAVYGGRVVPRFFYGDVVQGDNGYWLLPLDLSGCQVHWIQATSKLNLMGPSYLYMELDGFNCIDETQPYTANQFTLTTNQTNGIVNASFSKMSIPSTPLSQWFDKDSVPYKMFYPPAERIRKLSFRIRYHNGQLVDFGVFNYSFMLEFNLVIPQILRYSKTAVYPIR